MILNRPPALDTLDAMLVAFGTACSREFRADDVLVSVELVRAFDTIAVDETFPVVMVALVTLLVHGLRMRADDASTFTVTAH